MDAATERADLLSEEQQRNYLALAETALQQYALGPATPTFIQHNAGMVFRIEGPMIGQPCLLKLHERVGTGTNPSAAQLEAGLHWLAAFAQASDVVVQTPVTTITGQFVGQVLSTPSAPPISCTLQEWIDGRLPNGYFTMHQAQQIGKLMAKIHTFSRTYPYAATSPAMRHDTRALANNIHLLRKMLDATLLTHHDWDVIIAAQNQIVACMARLGMESTVWGPVHGDLHYDNLLFYHDDIRPIDFTGLRLAHYLYDIGVTLYHSFYQGPAIRHAFLAGYRQIVALPDDYQRSIEAFITYAAIDNIAWNSTIPMQVKSALFQRNLWQLVDAFCVPVAEGRAFLFL